MQRNDHQIGCGWALLFLAILLLLVFWFSSNQNRQQVNRQRTQTSAQTSAQTGGQISLPTATWTPWPTVHIAPSSISPETLAAESSCSCQENLYNCSDFATSRQAQACMLRCYQQTGADIHWLDGDDDGDACELLP